jgi:hypothetical protein
MFMLVKCVLLIQCMLFSDDMFSFFKGINPPFFFKIYFFTIEKDIPFTNYTMYRFLKTNIKDIH